MQNHCMAEGGYCINTIPPQPPRPKVPRKRRPARRRGMPKTKTRKGRRRGGPRTPARRPGAKGPPAASPPYQAPPPQQTWNQPPQQAWNHPPQQTWNQPPQQQQQNWFNNPMSWMLFGTRKKRQAPAAGGEPPEPGEGPAQIQPGQSVMSFLNTNCRKAEPDFSCMKTGGWCCRPFPV